MATPKKGVIFTAGYEGESVKTFLAKIGSAGVECLIDVRNNPLSRKPGFSKRKLSELCKELNIDYVHLPKLGIPSSYRKDLKHPADYEKLFAVYEKELLPKASPDRFRAASIGKDRPSVLMCFEKEPRCCHRGFLAQALSSDTGMQVIHL